MKKTERKTGHAPCFIEDISFFVKYEKNIQESVISQKTVT